MKERLYRVLNIKFSESSQVFDLLTVQFFIGLANALTNIIAFTLFVYNFPVRSLPLVYLVIAGVLIIFNFIYEKLEHSISPLQLLKYIIGFAAILLVVLWIGVSYVHKGNFIFILLVASVLLYMLTGYAFWGLVSLLFNVRESRRVFSIVGAGDIPAKLIGYVAAPLLIPFLGINNLIWFAVLSLLTGLYLFNKYIRKKTWDGIRKKSHDEHHNTEQHFQKQGLVSFLFENKLIFAISLLSILSYNVFILIDYTFISQVKIRFENISDLAAYIAIFFAFGRLIALAFKLIFTSRVIEKLGVVSCLFITPIALFLFCLVFLVYGHNPKYNLFIFGLMAMLTEVLRSTMQEPVFFILFQPLKEKLRLKGHIISKGYMYPPSLIIVGASLLLLSRSGVEVTILLAIKVIIINLCIWATIIFFIRRTYLNTIHASIRRGTFSSDEIYITDQQTIRILLEKVSTGKKSEVIYALNLLEKAGYENFPGLVQEQLTGNVDVEVKKYALERLELTGRANVEILRSLLADEQDKELKQKIVSLLCKYDPAYLKQSSENIADHEYAVRKIIIINLLNQQEFNYLFKAGSEINHLLYSADAVERELGIEIISELKHVQFSDAIEQLINDREPAVKRAAITAACKLKMQSLLPAMIELLEKPADKNIVLKGLQVYGDALFEHISEIPKLNLVKHTGDFIKIASRIKGKHSTGFLLAKMQDPGNHADKIVHALWIKEYTPSTEEEKKQLQQSLARSLHTGHEKIKDHNQVPVFNDKELLKRSIRSEIKGDLAVALKICAVLYKKKEINRILELMEVDKNDKLYNAMEMLELVLPKKISKELNELFDFVLDPVHHKNIPATREINVLFNKVIFTDSLVYNPWTKAVCVYCSWKNNETALLKKMSVSTFYDEPLVVQETRAYVLGTIK